MVAKWKQPRWDIWLISISNTIHEKAEEYAGRKMKKEEKVELQKTWWRGMGTTPITWSLDHTPEKE